MKIAILTQPLRTNYGGILQNYALQKVLKRLGHTVVTLQRDRFIKVHYPRFFLTLGKRIILKFLGKFKGTLFLEKQYNWDYPIFTQHTARFINEYIEIKEINNFEIDINESDYDIYVVGSDQVWRPAYNQIYYTFLSFTHNWNVKRIAYAASFGTDEWEFSNEQTKQCSYLAKKFDSISVREKSGISLCENYLDVEAVQVLDPTMLLQRKDYELLISKNIRPVQGQLFVHMLDNTNDKNILISKICKTYGWEFYRVNCVVDEHEVNTPIEQRIQPPVEEWLQAFRDANFIVTDSFHATVFSILFNKRFLVYANEKRGLARFISLLEMFGLENRIITHSNQLSKQLFTPIDFDAVNEKLDILRKVSYEYIYKNIH